MNLISFLPAFKLLYGVPGRHAIRFYPTCLTSFQLTTQLTKTSSSTTEESGPPVPPFHANHQVQVVLSRPPPSLWSGCRDTYYRAEAPIPIWLWP